MLEIHFASSLDRFCISCQTQYVSRWSQLLVGLSVCLRCRRHQDLWRSEVQGLWLSWSSLFSEWFCTWLIPFGMSWCLWLFKYVTSCTTLLNIVNMLLFILSLLWSISECSSVSVSLSMTVSSLYFTCQSSFWSLYDTISPILVRWFLTDL